MGNVEMHQLHVLAVLFLVFLFSVLSAAMVRVPSGGISKSKPCSTNICPVCDKAFDLVFVIDGSGSIRQAGAGNFNLMKNFMKMLIEGFSVDFNKTHVAAVIYSSSVYVRKVFGLDTYYSYEDIFRAIDGILYPSGGTSTGKAITLVRSGIYTPRHDRDDVPNVCIIITDGKSRDDIEGPSHALLNTGTTIFALGVGKNYDVAELLEMAGNQRYVYTADFKDLTNLVQQMQLSICRVDGGWSYWEPWNKCTVTCGGGIQTRWRSCTNPPPRWSYRSCQGNSNESQTCNTNNCPIDGGWSEWSPWSVCTKTVSGLQARIRECDNPEPAYGGKKCNGTRAVVRECSNMSGCYKAFPLRLQSGENPSHGIMEIYKNGSWQKLCTRRGGTDEENLTCRAMGYTNGGVYNDGAWYMYADYSNASNSSIHSNCASLTDCKSDINDKTQLCKVPVRLNGSNIEYGGRVEVFYEGKWGKICRNKWNFEDVKVICRQLGFKRAVAEFVVSDIKDEDMPFVMSEVTCKGDEPELASCPRIDGKLNVDCQNDDTGAQALCEPKKGIIVLNAVREFLDVGKTETIRCSLENETNYISWFINNRLQEINSTSETRVNANKNGELTITNVQLSDGGTYECRGLEYTRYYTIYVNARFTDMNPEQRIVAGNSGIISCRAEGTPAPHIEWKRQDETPLDKARVTELSNGSLHINPVQPQDKGMYICTFRQSKGSERVTEEKQLINVFVIILPIIILFSGKRTYMQGESGILICKITQGLPEPQLSWFKNDVLLPDEVNTTLLLANVTDTDEGRYTCKAQNAGGDFKARIDITVKTPPELDPELRNLSVPLNCKFTKKCIVSGDLPLQINWTKNGVDLGNQNKNIYSVDNMTLNDTGLYGCTATNWAGQAQTTFWIDVTVSPQIYVYPRNKSVPEGHPANLSCKARGVPKPTVFWTFNDGDLPSGVNQTNLGEGSFLESSNTIKQMEGIYKCTAQNKANTTTSSAYLHVFEKPSADVSPKPYPKLSVGDELRLTCTVSKATVAINWKKNDDEVIPRAQIDTQVDEKLSKLYIAEVVESDSGEYSCEARNRPGVVARSTVKINVKSVKGSVAWLAQEWYYIVGPVIGCIVIFVVGWFICKRRRAAMAKLPDQEQSVKMELLNVEVDEWEIAVDRVVLQEVIGRGAFGAVWRALLKEPDGKSGNRTVAAKCFTPTSGEDGRKSLIREIELGKLLGENPQTNIVEFIGCVTTQVHPILVMEYLACGDLLGYLRKSRGIDDKYHLGQGNVPELEIYDLVLFAKQIAAGMVFLGSRGIIHRDLAARNVLLDDNFVCKVTDFGLAYQDFKYGHGNAKKGCMPIKWTAPEILSGEFSALSTQSDVWSYGIVLYEIFTIGGIPYPGWSEGRVVQAVLDGYQMPKPDHIDDQLYEVMTRCWNLNPDFRPPFENLRKRMDTYLREETYTDLLNMGKYDSVKYSKVEDLGAQGEPPSEQVGQVKTSNTGKKLGKWSSVR